LKIGPHVNLISELPEFSCASSQSYAETVKFLCAVHGSRIHRLLASWQGRHQRSHLWCTGVTQ